jgi:carboxylesterase type B
MLIQLIFVFLAVSANAVLQCPKLCSYCPCVHGAEVHTSRSGGQYEAYLGIPYAVKPVGELRFKNPKRNTILPPVLTGEKHKCIQRNLFLWRLQITGNEDCLYLNIYRPRTSGDNLPVLVYLPHSNFLYGSGLSRDTAPDIIMENKHIVLVVVQFRVGMLGFFSTGDRHAPGNLGLKDQQLALDWIKEMIRFFSGNKDDITVFGDASVQYQLMQPSIVFHKAIISGNYAFSYYDGVGAQKASVAAKAARVFSWTLYDKVLSNRELIAKLQQEPIDKLMGVQGLIHVSWTAKSRRTTSICFSFTESILLPGPQFWTNH